MKPLRLAAQAFGPFWNQVEVDFQPVHPHGLFLIHGPVGSGKTSLMDAICFSLFGVSSGGERSAAQLRCDLAADSTATLVEFDFEAQGKAWRVRRDLEQCQLSALDGSLPSPDTAAAEKRIHRLLGLDSLQFRRAVMLPQGQFRQFLLAPAGERERILSALFQTRSPVMVEAALERAHLDLEEELSRAWQRREQLAAQGDVHDLRRVQEIRLRKLERQLEQWKELQHKVLQNRERAVLVNERSRERQRTSQELQQLLTHENDLDELRGLARRYRAALQVAPQVEQWEQARSEELQAEEQFEEADRELQRRLQELTSPQQVAGELEVLQQRRHELLQQLQELDRIEREQRRLVQGEEQLLKCQQTWNELEEEGHALAQDLEQARHRQAEVERFNQEERDLRERLQTSQASLEALKESLRAQRQQAELQAGIERLEAGLARIGERRNRVLDQVDKLERDVQQRTRLLEQHWAGELARQLKAGLPCAVCGSEQHPRPAEAGGAPAQLSLEQLRKQLDQAWKQAEGMEQEEQEQQLQLARLHERLTIAREKVADRVEVSGEEVQEITQQLRDLEREMMRLQRYREASERDQKRVRKLEKRRERWQEARLMAQQALSQVQGMVEERRQQLPAALSTPALVQRRRQELQEQLEPLQRELESQRLQLGQDSHLYASLAAAAEAARKGIELSRERTRLAFELMQARLQLGGFRDLEEWRGLHQGALSDLETIEAELHSHEQKRRILEEELERAETLYHESLEDWSELEVPPDELEKRLAEGYAEVAECQERLRQLDRQIQDYQRCQLEIQELEPRVARLRRLVRTAQGQNASGLSYLQWVLSRQMESVLQAANLHLHRMTSGRFSLEAGKSALELEVCDHLSGQSRSVMTLSGGESFLASLALALGLSESFLQTESTTLLETLFIDEGFGYLDEEGLDQAFTALESIQRDGRMIGLISHLPEIRQRVPRRLEIRPHPSGHQMIWHH